MNANTGKQQIEAMYPVAGIQRGMIFHSLLAPRSGVYVLQDGLLLSDQLDVDAFWRTWQAVIARHPVFRTLFVRLDTEKPVQVVLKDVALPKTELDWSALCDEERDAAFAALLKDEQERGFDFAKAPLMRLCLIKRNDGAWYFVWTRHHVLLDGWSKPLVLRDVMQCYEALRNGQAPRLPPVRGYQDFVRWLATQDIAAARAYWGAYLDGLDDRTPAPLINDAGTAERRVDDLRAQLVRVPAAVSRAIDGFARREQVTLNVLMQAAWALLLSTYSARTEVTFGATVSGRPPTLAGVESIVGPFINTLPLRVAVDPRARLGDWLRDLQRANAQRADFEYLPLIEIQSLGANAERGALFDTLLVFDNYPLGGDGAEGDIALKARPLSSFSYNNYPLTLMVMPGEELLLQFKYDGARFDEASIATLLGHLRQLIERMLVDPTQALGALCPLSASETGELLAQSRGSRRAFARTDVGSLFGATAAAHPERPALVCGAETLTYAQLDAASNRLANCLLAYGVGPEARVGLCTARNAHFVVALLAILKTGAAYVPIDGEWPEHRVHTVLATARARLVVTEQAMLERVALDDLAVLSLDRDADEIASFPEQAPGVAVSPQQLAYVIYTSGSTGTPKGVGVSHAALHEYALGVLPRIDADEAGELAALSTFAADLGYTALYGALCTGRTLRLLPEALTLDAPALAAELARRPIDVLKIVPSHLEALLAAVPSAKLLPRRCLVLGGESPSPALLERIRALSDCRIVNHYGPTETTVGALTCDLTRPRAIAIGHPMENRDAHVLDRSMKPVPAGAIGEIHLGGAGLARGYLDDPRLTAERFVPDPFALEPGQRLYRSGDRARRLPDGSVQYLGRLDQQIKLRGHRIEIGEIESFIRGLPGVAAAAVALQADGAAPRLVAFVVAGEGWSEDDAGRECALRLPEAMRPSQWAMLERLPLTANGKLDRAALPAAHAVTAAHAYVAPRSATEETLAALWAELLKRERVGVEDNFFALGGNSLLIIQAHGRLKKLFETELSVLDLFKYPTIAKLSGFLRGARAAGSGLDAVQRRVERQRGQMQGRRQHESLADA